MATKQVVRELVTLWGFDIDQAPLKEVDAGINVIKQSLKGLAVSLATSAAAVGLLLNEAGEDEQTRISFETMLGSAEAMEKKLRELESFATKTPFTLKGIKTNSTLLLGMGIDADNLIPTLKSLGDVSAGLSLPLERLALNYGQVRNQNKLTGRELRDFAVAGVPLLDELAKNLGKTTKEISAMVSRGEIGFSDVEKAFKTMTSGSGKFSDLMAKQSKSLFGLLSNVQDILQLIARDLGNELLPEAKRIVKEFMQILEVNEKLIKQNLTDFVKNLAKFMGDLFDISVSLFRSMSKLVKVFGGWNKVLKITFNTTSAIIGLGLAVGIGLITKAVFLATGALFLKSVAMASVLVNAIAIGGVLPGLSFAFQALGNSALIAQAKVALVPLAIFAAMAAMALVAEDLAAFSDGRDSVFGRMIEGLDSAFEALEQKFGGFSTFLKIFLAGILAPTRVIVNSFKSIGTIIDVIRGKKTILDGIKQAGQNVLSTFSPFLGNSSASQMFGFADNLNSVGRKIGESADPVMSGLGKPFNNSNGGQKSVAVSSKNEINLNLLGMNDEAAKELVTETLSDQMDFILRTAVRDGESAIER